MTLSAFPTGVVPAQLGFLAIFNPSLGNTDDTIDDQIVYYASVNTQTSRRRLKSRARPTENISQEERNERLRQIGLAQGMVEFGKGFSGGKSVDTIETEKARVVLHELEPGWWILTSIDLTQLPLPPKSQSSLTTKAKDEPSPNIEFSAREVKPADLLLQDLLRAHSVFLLHHAASLSALFVRSQRSKFVSLLGRYWDMWLSTWNVMLHGNPINNVFGGIKIAACGELGVGVGEEERGSGEREVLEGFVGRVEGLVDVIVSKFGDTDPEALEQAENAKAKQDDSEDDDSSPPWLGTGEEPGAEDGAIFLGVGALSRKSLRDVAYWMEDIFTWGEAAYGVKDSPTSMRQARRTRRAEHSAKVSTSKPADISAFGKATDGPDQASNDAQVEADQGDEGVSKVMNYLKLGYGKYWTLGQSGNSETGEGGPIPPQPEDPQSRPRHVPPALNRINSKGEHETGHYLIGLMGDVEDTALNNQDSTEGGVEEAEYNSRTLLRTLTIELEGEALSLEEEDVAFDLGSRDNDLTIQRLGVQDMNIPKSSFDSQDRNKSRKMRVVVYVNKPFIYTFLFLNRTDSLAWGTLYRSLHYQLAPLRKPLINSTAYRPGKPDAGAAASHIFDLIWDPRAKTLHSTIPNIPDPLQNRSEIDRIWSRVDALNTHMQILNQFAATRGEATELERTCKTSRGWWIVWTRLLDKEPISSSQEREMDTRRRSDDVCSGAASGLNNSSEDVVGTSGKSAQSGTSTIKERNFVSKEILLIRKASDHGGGAGFRAISSSYAEGGGGWADGASRLAQGIGVDTRKYIEGLLSMSR